MKNLTIFNKITRKIQTFLVILLTLISSLSIFNISAKASDEEKSDKRENDFCSNPNLKNSTSCKLKDLQNKLSELNSRTSTLEANAGRPGPQGIAGPIGPIGPKGFKGLTGDIGPIGPTGEKGPIGDQGIQGIVGVVGAMGPIGPQGETGLTGPTGEQGPMGPQGPVGAQGAQGPQGAQGTKGEKGSDGVNKLAGKVELIDENVVFTGINLHLRSGSGDTYQANSKGNLFIGYNGAGQGISYVQNFNRLDELKVSGIPTPINATAMVSGSHNLIIGDGHHVEGSGSLVSGYNNTVKSNKSAVLGGTGNQLFAEGSAVAGGSNNQTGSPNQSWGSNSAVLAGNKNAAISPTSLTMGGSENFSGHKNVDGGYTGKANVVVLGGEKNFASGESSVITGGRENTNNGAYSTVSGGSGNIIETEASYASIIGSKNSTIKNSTIYNSYGVIAGSENNILDSANSIMIGGTSNILGFGSADTIKHSLMLGGHQHGITSGTYNYTTKNFFIPYAPGSEPGTDAPDNLPVLIYQTTN